MVIPPHQLVHMESARRTSVFFDELPWDIRSKNTDWRYVRFDLPKLSHFEPSLDLTMQTSAWISVRENAKVLRAAVGRRTGFPLSRRDELTSSLSEGDLRQSAADVVFAHRALPLNAGKTPVVWQNCVLDPEMQLAYGATQAEIDDETNVKGSLYKRAAAIQVSTAVEAERLGRTFPDIADRFVGVPFFTPHVQPCDLACLDRHLEDGPVRILFVGNQVWRKGLDLLLDAFLALPEATRKITELTVITNFVGPTVVVPQHPRITILRGANSKLVMQEMSRSHIFVNAARFESYGLVFHEAMSQGLACLAPHWEVQRELFDDGRAGRLMTCDARAIQSALEELIDQSEKRYEIGVAAWKRFKERYAPAVVARRYAELFQVVANGRIL